MKDKIFLLITFTITIVIVNLSAETLDEDFNFEFCKTVKEKYLSYANKIDSFTCEVEYSAINNLKNDIGHDPSKIRYRNSLDSLIYTLKFKKNRSHDFTYNNYQVSGDVDFDQMLLNTHKGLLTTLKVYIRFWKYFTYNDMQSLLAADSMVDNISHYTIEYENYRNWARHLLFNVSKDYVIQKVIITSLDSSSQNTIEPKFELHNDKYVLKSFDYYDISAHIKVTLLNHDVDGFYLPMKATINTKMTGMEINTSIYFKNYKIYKTPPRVYKKKTRKSKSEK